MKIILYQYRPNIRLFKWAVSLRRIGHQVTIAYDRDPGELPLKKMGFDVKHRKELLMSSYDAYVNFNPNTPHAYQEDVRLNVQAVGDFVGINRKNKHEVNALKHSQLFVFVSYEQMLHAILFYGVSKRYCHVLPNAIVPEQIEAKPKQRPPHEGTRYVYAGLLTKIEKHHKNTFDYLQSFISDDSELHIYPATISTLAFTDSRVRMHKPVPPLKLISELSQYDVGIIALNDTGPVYRQSLPNKFFEYKAAGLKVVRPRGMTSCDDFEAQHGNKSVVHFFDEKKLAEFFPIKE